MRYSPRIRGRGRFGRHPENGPPPKQLSDAEAYQHEVDRIANGLLLQRKKLTRSLGFSPRLRTLARSMADRLIDHHGDDVGRDDGLAATVLAFGCVCDASLAEWRLDLQQAVAAGVGPTSMEDATRLLARMVLARDLEHQAQEFDELRSALQLDEST